MGEEEDRTARRVEPGPGFVPRLALPNAVVATIEVKDDAELVEVAVKVEAEVATEVDVETDVITEAEMEAKVEVEVVVVVKVDGKEGSEVDTELGLSGVEAVAAPPVGVPAASWKTKDGVLQHAVLANAAFSQQ